LIRSREIIGETSDKLSNKIKEEFTNVNWREMKLMRNKPIHNYVDIALDLVWQTLVLEIPKLKE
jgi:uncharacterized protein with HEPN domain